MSRRTMVRHRIKISATVDPALLRAVDAYVAERAGLDRSTVIDEALRLWYARQQELAMEAQYVAGEDEMPPPEEWTAWTAIRRAATEHLTARSDER